jgi:hypothetical protein
MLSSSPRVYPSYDEISTVNHLNGCYVTQSKLISKEKKKNHSRELGIQIWTINQRSFLIGCRIRKWFWLDAIINAGKPGPGWGLG